MADILACIAQQVLRAPPPAGPAIRHEVADLLARADAAIARRAH